MEKEKKNLFTLLCLNKNQIESCVPKKEILPNLGTFHKRKVRRGKNLN